MGLRGAPSWCCCCCLGGACNEDNARFALLAALILLYLLCGAAVFSALERPSEREAQQRWQGRLQDFSRRHNLSAAELRAFLRHYEAAFVAGVRAHPLRPRWDFPGAFYFVGTVVSTIGFGMTTPATIAGKIFLIFYGLIGCAGTILFFNLFLERLITIIAYIMKSCHERRLRRSGALTQVVQQASGITEVDSLAGWKPSVYYVMLILCLASLIISCCASAMYTPMEGWSYFESLYFCFVAFSTIGFGDLVSSQNAQYENQGLYRFGNFIFILMGVCCIYSLFNVISIVIKQSINWILKKLEWTCHKCQRKFFRSRRNVVVPGTTRNQRNISIESDGVIESDTDGRRMSGEMISMKDLLASNKVSLAIMQKQLSDSANGFPRQMNSVPRQNGFAGGVGALGIMNNRLAETSTDR
ncbi:potassium channel subfamily K member 13 [Anolis carolinensis]|uniref:Potassium two pore domain channel subfamily K member 13 n=1 Tax=Anolis carolinensis TaxID=28377 RepID=A0A803TQP7_ANOCA|nr:PREDICTED: potassium channel subfamily K member 13 [Anolis carolinensis]|eukprot:XP_003214460.1 PREDICTED: potassium channel subfamily K member 13 [Anolis carolinensis]